MHPFARTLLKWYDKNKRDLPWRDTRDPYRIWLSEVILQQTRVNQGLPYYQKFTYKYPAIADLAAAPEEEVLKLWQGLGYYSRARNMLLTARLVNEQYNGVFPADYEKIKALKGIGDYTAAAIASFAYNLPHPVVDGNVYRVMARVFGLSDPVNTGTARKRFTTLASEIIPPDHAALYNQAVMEFGALLCTPRSPSCAECPVSAMCYAREHDMVDRLPVKTPKRPVKERWFNYLVAVNRDSILIRRRTGNDIWKNLYEFPLIESEGPADERSVLEGINSMTGRHSQGYTFGGLIAETSHQLTHRRINARFYKLSYTELNIFLNSDIFEIRISDLQQKYALPRLLERFCETHLF